MNDGVAGVRRWVNGFDRVVSWIEQAFIVVASILLVAMMLVVTWSVLGRYFFHSPNAWSVELSEYMMLYIAFLVGAWVLRENGHVQVEIIVDKFPPKVRKVVDVVMMVLAAAACILLFWFSLQTTLDHYERNVRLINILTVDKYLLLAIIPVGSLLLFLRYVRKILAQFGL